MTALAFERLHVRRMPGIVDAGFELDSLSPGLNVVHGPNASGKTTTADAIEALLWPRTATEHASVSAHLRLDGEAWTVGVDGRQAHWQRDGANASAPGLPAAEARDRYRLSLHELLKTDGEGFAQAIARESAGGYDLAAAARALDARGVASRCTKEIGALKEAKSRLDGARRAQSSLQTEGRRLHDLDEKLAGRGALATRIGLLELAIEHAQAKAKAALMEQAMAEFDPRMEQLLGDEAERLRVIAEKLGAARELVRGAESDQERAKESLAACGLPESGLPLGLLHSLRHELGALREQEREIASRQQALSDAEARRQRMRTAIGSVVDADRLREMSTDGVNSLSDFAREADSLAARRRVLEAQLVAQPDAAPTSDRETLDRGVWLLRRWLQSGGTGGARVGRLRVLATIAAVGLIAASVVLTLAHPAFAIGAAAGVVLLFLILRPGAHNDPRTVHQAEFLKIRLQAPAEWVADAVEARLAELEADLASARLTEERARRRTEIAAELALLEPREGEIAARREEIIQRLGVDPRTSNESLVWLVERIGHWHDAQADAEGAAAALETVRAQLAAGLADATNHLAGYAALTMPDVAALAGVLDGLEQRQKDFESANGQLSRARKTWADAVRTIESLESEHSAIHERLGTLNGDLSLIEAWCADLDRFRVAREDRRLAVRQRDSLAGRLTNVPDLDPSFLDQDEVALADQLTVARESAGELDRLHDEATAIRTRIEDAKRANAMEEALSEVAVCEDALRAVREKDVRSVLADLLMEFVQSATRDQHLPQVFHRAREIFARITHGRYRLDFEGGESPAFRAYDTTTGVGHALTELSSASRIHLLLAVRLAFVETQEQGIRLPLILDETLGNSDDQRAEAIMEALLEIAAQGRQVFYFTAQADEVGKWQGLLDRHSDAAGTVIDLARWRRIAGALDTSRLRVLGPPRREIPSPGVMTHAEYGAALSVPALDPRGAIDAAHLWYLVHEPGTLHDLLTRTGAERWGALRNLVEQGALGWVDAELYARIRGRARALELALSLRRIGHGHPVDRSVLDASGAITGKFLDAVTGLCRSNGGEARRVLEALENGEVKHFHRSAREKLKDYLEANGHLDLRDPLDPAEIRARMLASVAEEIACEQLTVADVDRLLAMMDASLSDPSPIV